MLRWHFGSGTWTAILARGAGTAGQMTLVNGGRAPEWARTSVALAAAAVLALGASGCGAARPPRYYQLEVPSAPVASTPNPYPITLLVGHIGAPDLLRGDRLVYRTGPVQMGTYEYDRWSERPTEMVQATLVEMLRDSGRFRSVQRAASHARGDFEVRGHLTRLEEVDDASGMKAAVALDLELFQVTTGETLWYRTYAHDEPVSTKSVPAVVEALDRNVQRCLQQLTGELLQYFNDHPPKNVAGSDK